MKRLALIALLLSSSARCLAQNRQPPVYRDLSKIWITRNWMDDDKAQRMCAQVDALVKKQGIEATWAWYQAKNRQNPTDDHFKLAWTYASILAADHGIKGAEREMLIGFHFLTRQTLPLSFEYARTRFLIEAMRNQGARHLQPVGRRIIARNPKDYITNYYFVMQLHPGDGPQARAEALKVVARLKTIDPKRPSAYSAQGMVYYLCYIKSNDPADAMKSIAGYKRFLAIAPRSHRFRPQVQLLLDTVRSRLETQKELNRKPRS